MQKGKVARVAGFVASAGLTVGLIGAAGAATGAYFQDAEAGTIRGTVGTIQIDNETSTSLVFEKMLPGESATRSATFVNEGNREQDVYFDLGSVPGISDAQLADALAAVGFAVNGTPVTSTAPVAIASGLAPGATVGIDVSITVPAGVTWDQVAPHVATMNAAVLGYQVVATQPGQPVR